LYGAGAARRAHIIPRGSAGKRLREVAQPVAVHPVAELPQQPITQAAASARDITARIRTAGHRTQYVITITRPVSRQGARRSSITAGKTENFVLSWFIPPG
jgi:hypothetical protein